MLRRTQEAFALMQSTAAPAALLQALVVLRAEGLTGTSLAIRLSVNLALATIMLIGLIAFTRRGKVYAAARFVGFGMILFDLTFAIAFGMRGSPTPYVITLAIMAVLAMVERPRVLAAWTALFAAVLIYGLLATPLWPFNPRPVSLVTGVAFTLAFFGLYLTEFREAMLDAVANIRQQADALTRTNADLRRTIVERDELSAQLATAQRLEAMGRMAGSIAHDFNNQLTVIRGYADLIANDTPSVSPLRAEMEQLVSAISRASNITREVLDFATPRAIALQPTDLVDVIRRLGPDLRRLILPRVRLEVDLPTAPCIAAADRAQVERLILNLAINARDVTPANGAVTVRVYAKGDRVFCQVTDGGPGVPLAIRDRIFEPFFTTKGTTGGTGLGLASSYAIARQHGGVIRVDDAEGGGASFTFELPRHSSSDLPAIVPAFDATLLERRLPLDGKSVVLVEDDEALRRLAMRMLQRAGAIVSAFDNGVDAVEYIAHADREHSPVQLIVTDLRLPRGSGADVIAAARALSAPIAIVAISGFLEDPAVAERAAREELFFLPKPFCERQLLSAIDSAQRLAAA